MMSIPLIKRQAALVLACSVLLTIGACFLLASPRPIVEAAAPAIGVACLLVAITIARPLWLFPLVAALSPMIFAVHLLTAQVIPADFVVASLLLACVLARRGPGWNAHGRAVLLPLLVFVAVCLITVPISANPGFGAVKVVQRAEFALLFAATVTLLRDRATMVLSLIHI